MDQMKIVIESLLTGSHFEIAINELDKILMVKTNIQKILGEFQMFCVVAGSWATC